jgi:hypothetical protein
MALNSSLLLSLKIDAAIMPPFKPISGGQVVAISPQLESGQSAKKEGCCPPRRNAI